MELLILRFRAVYVARGEAGLRDVRSVTAAACGKGGCAGSGSCPVPVPCGNSLPPFGTAAVWGALARSHSRGEESYAHQHISS